MCAAQILDKYIRASGGSDGAGYFLGDRYSYAETITTPFLRRALLVLKAHRGFDILGLARSNSLDRLLQWIQVLHLVCWMQGLSLGAGRTQAVMIILFYAIPAKKGKVLFCRQAAGKGCQRPFLNSPLPSKTQSTMGTVLRLHSRYM